MQHVGNPTMEETIAFFDAKIAKLNREKAELKAQNKKFLTVLDELCANAEPVCDSLEMGQTLKSPKTLINFRKALNDGWAAIPEVE
jgi:hypothetical protein